MIVVPVPNEDRRRPVSRCGKKFLNRARVGGDSWRAAKQSHHARHHLSEGRVAEKRRGQQHMPLVLDQQSRNAEIGDRHHVLWIAAVGWCTAYWPRARLNLRGDGNRGSTSNQQQDEDCELPICSMHRLAAL